MLLAIDQGTTGTTCLVFDDELRTLGRGYREVRQSYPRPGWVEHDPEDLWESVLAAARDALGAAEVRARDLVAVGIANQRETTIVWERRSGRPVAPAIVWQDRRTAARCRELPAELLRARTGLVPDPYFSATKLEWLLGRVGRPAGELAFGTVDAWLLWRLTGGSVHATDETNASRTLLLDLTTLDWDDELLALFGVERELLPRVVPSSGVVAEVDLLGATLPVAGIAGDQQAALVGQGCFAAGEAKVTYGTGSFVLVHAGPERVGAADGLLETAAARLGPHRAYALEGAVLAAGAALEWLCDCLAVDGGPEELEALARSVSSSGGAVFVPALAGLGSPWWQPDARGLLCGLTRGTSRAHLARAALEAIALQVADVVDAVPAGMRLLRADGGVSANAFVMQLQADLLGTPVEVAEQAEATALGAAVLAGLAVGLWGGPDEVARLVGRTAVRYEPAGDPGRLDALREAWRDGLRRTRLR